MSCNLWISEVETINGRPGLRMVVHRRPKSMGGGLACGLGYSPALSVTYSVAAVAACGAMRVSRSTLPLLLHPETKIPDFCGFDECRE